MSVALARSFRIVDPDLNNPMSQDWARLSSYSTCCTGLFAACAAPYDVGLETNARGGRCATHGLIAIAHPQLRGWRREEVSKMCMCFPRQAVRLRASPA